MYILKPERKLAILTGLIEGCSVRSISRMNNTHIKTVLKVLVNSAQRCEQIVNEQIRGLRCEALELDEVWTFIQKKQRRLTAEDRLEHPEFGDAYTYVALEPDSKLVVAYWVGKRDTQNTDQFIADLSRRVDGGVQLSTDGFLPYIQAIQRHFGHRATHGEIIKLYAPENPGRGRYSPPHVVGVEINQRWGIPDPGRICTSYVERNNWTIRCQVRRFTRLTNAFSRKLENLKAAVSLWFAYYNLCRVHGSLRITPAMAAGLTDRVWELRELMA
jgi:IS1 family transposase